MSTNGAPLLEVEHLKVDFSTDEGVVHSVDDVSFRLGDGEVLAVVGESGSGKSVTAMTLMCLTRSPNARFGSGKPTRAKTSIALALASSRLTSAWRSSASVT